MNEDKPSKNGKSRNFLIELIGSYKNFIECTATSLDNMANIQKKYKDLYDRFKEFQFDPSNIIEMIKSFEKDEIAVTLSLMMRMEELNNRMANLISLSSKEQKKLANDLREFAKDFEENIVKLKKEEV